MDLFQKPIFLLWALAAAGGAAALAAAADSRRRRLLGAFAMEKTLARVRTCDPSAPRRARLLLDSGALVLLLLALAGPQWGVELVETINPGSQTVIAVDTSMSMLAEDIEPSRMGKAQSALSQLLDGLRGTRVGLVAFAREAHIQCPVTYDVDAAKSLLKGVRVGMIPQEGTDVPKAIRLAVSMLKRYPGEKGLVLLTDGENHGGDPDAAALEAAEAGVRIYLIGTGTPEGAPIPVRDASGALSGYMKDSRGQTVLSKLGEPSLMKLAAAAGGAYYRASPSESEVAEILRQVSGLKASGASRGTSTRMRNRFRIPLAAAFLLLMAGLLVPEGPGWSRLAGAVKAASILALFLLAAGCSPREDIGLWRGNRAYRGGRYEDALARYLGASRGRKGLFNSGDARYKMGDFERAGEAFEKAARSKGASRKEAAAAYHNLGNSRFRREDFPGAAEAYRRCLTLSPGDEDCRHNLALSLHPPKKRPEDQKKKQDSQGGGKKDRQDQERRQQSGSKPQGQAERRSGMSREDAERILQAVRERERQAPPRRTQSGDKETAGSGENW
jgi:Ca-activated chloride channel family protein